MECPFCRQDNDKVVDSRASGAAIRRRRECLACKRRYTTYERAESEPRLRVIKKDGTTREAYDRAKIRRGLMLALHKRPVPTERLNAILQEIEDELTSRYDLEIPSRAIGDLVMEKLRQVDQVAYVRFASVYRDFKDVSEFVQEVQPMLTQRADAAREKGKDRSSEDSRATGGD
ncbi:MAG TPA: transcriptional regulator NrdR [Phycisphaerae bacterium]|nr:transcriptional regulator NrdR [Phycisphaerae bacterium]